MKKLLPLLVVAILLLCTSCSDGATQIEIITTPSNFDGNTNMTNTQAETSTATINNPYPGEVLYKGIPVLSFFNSGYYDALGLIGDPLKEELVDSDSTLFRYDYDAMQIFAYAQTGELTSVVATDPSAFSMNGITLDKDRAGIIKIFGNPSAEWDDRGYEMVYQFDDLEIYVSMNSPDEKAFEVLIKPNDNYSSDTNDSININIDTELVGGRWVSGDGKRLEFFNDGTVTTNLDIWSLDYGWPDSDRDTTWQASNGELVLRAHTVRQIKYTVNGEYMKIEGYKDIYERREGTGTGTGVFGEWMPMTTGGGGLALYEDGTGYNQLSQMGKCTWSTDSEVLTFWFTSGKVFDYVVQGNQLIVYGKSSSTIYTKIGQ